MSFTITAALPAGTSVIEASAGTGKTYAIVSLATRAVALGDVSPDQLMLVTFTQVATQELRGRVRDRFARTADALADPAVARAGSDELVQYLADAADTDVAQRRARLLQALSDFDAITIATTHSFCQRMLDSLGIAGHREHYQFQESVSDLLADVVDDLYLNRFADRPIGPFNLSIARDIATAATSEPSATVAPTEPADGSVAHDRVEFAAAARAELARRKTLMGLRDYNDLLTFLWQSLSDPDNGEQACQLIRERYRLVLVDEFQDTDPLQWDILHRAFHGHVTLVLVGDPKQAIYAFRGAEVLSYLDAVSVAEQTLTLDINRRSDPGILTALENLYGGAALGHPAILARHVQPATTSNRYTGPALRLRYFDRSGAWPVAQNSGLPNVAGVRARVARDVADDIATLLNSGVAIGTGSDTRAVAPGDIAVLVQRRATQAIPVRDELTAAGISTVLLGDAGVFATSSATAWHRLLRAMEEPHRASKVRLAALTPLFGGTITDLATDPDTWTADHAERIARYSKLFADSGIAAVYEQITADTALHARLLAHDNGEREITDQRHIAQLLHYAATGHNLGITGLTEWLTARINAAATDTNRTRSRLLDSDADAVRILTIHGAKGLEFPIVYVPFGWDFVQRPTETVYQLHENNTRILDVGGPTDPGHAARKTAAVQENSGEQLRNLYVALTRAQYQLTIWWAPSGVTAHSPLHRFLFGRNATSPEPAAHPAIPADNAIPAAFATWASPAGDSIATEHVPATPATPRPTYQQPPQPTPALAAATFNRHLDYTWRRTSYSALTSAAHTPNTTSEPDDYIVTDEPAATIAMPPGTGTPGPATSTPSPLNAFDSNASFGTLVHSILEQVDTSAADLAADVTARTADAVASRLTSLDIPALAAAITAVLHTPIGNGILAEVAPNDRLSELQFELPIGGGDTPTIRQAGLRDIADTVRAHLDPADPLAAYPDVLASIDASPLRGFLTGSIDAVLRRPGPRFDIVDYKTNALGPLPASVERFDQNAMAAEMIRDHYPLQALMYAVALHRYLTWRLPGYEPDLHLGAVHYLFVRGMIGPDTPDGCGVFTWRPSATLIVALSEVLAGHE